MSIGTFIHPSLCLFICQYINTYLKAIVSLFPYQFAQMLILTDWAPWLTCVLVAFITDRILGYKDMPNDVFVIITSRTELTPIVEYHLCLI